MLFGETLPALTATEITTFLETASSSDGVITLVWAIKAYRERTGLGLREAKQAALAAAASLGYTRVVGTFGVAWPK
jgi:ribosomal protein L7/L12